MRCRWKILSATCEAEAEKPVVDDDGSVIVMCHHHLGRLEDYRLGYSARPLPRPMTADELDAFRTLEE